MGWRLASEDELPDSFRDPCCKKFLFVCSNGWEGDVSIGSAFWHKPRRYPKCFPVHEGDSVCTIVLLREEQP